MRSFLTTMLVLVLSTGMTVACGGDDPVTFIDSPVVGSWSAISVDGRELPYSEEALIDDILCSLTLRGLHFTFGSDGRYFGNDEVTRLCAGFPEADVSSTFRGRWRLSGDLMYMRPDRGVEDAVSYSVEGSILRITFTDEFGEESNTVFVRN